jgi:NAD-dependent DNA ligase
MFQSIFAPSHCPSCDSMLVWKNDLLYCVSTTCGEQSYKSVEHFAKTMKIKGLGPASVRKLGWTCPSEIYRTPRASILASLGSEKVTSKLLGEIVNSFNAPLELLLPAFGIPLIGKTATLKLSETVSHITEINADTCERAGLGPKATNNLLDWIENELEFFVDVMPHSWYFSDTPPPVVSKGTVCISGRLKSFKSKADATTALNAAGYEVKSSLTKQVGFLINEGGAESAKTRQARDTGVTIITDLKSFLEN